jgi:ligand-binding sensor protein
MSVSNTLNRVDNATTLQKFQEMFSCLTGLWVTFINSNAEFVSSVRGCRKFCVLMSEVEKERAVSRCWISNYNACQQVIQSQKPLIYECYAGLTEIIVPIIINDRSVGAVITGQIREKNNDPFDNKNISLFLKNIKTV